MRVLLDTHAFLWALLEPEKLSRAAKRVMEDPENKIILSTVSAWEVSTKHRLGKLVQANHLIHNYGEAVDSLQADELSLSRLHALRAGAWPAAHRDPFDRMLAAQADLEGLPLVTGDPAFAQFGVRVIW